MAGTTANGPWIVAIGLGSNMPGDTASPDAQVRAAATAVRRIPGTELVNASQLYATPPWGIVTQDEFRNAVLRVRTEQPPLDFLHACQEIEQDAGRVRLQHWGPRTVDVDLLAAYAADGTPVISRNTWGKELILPHPYSSVRGFVLVPWAEIAPDDELADLPTERGGEGTESYKTVGEWVAQLGDAETAGITPVGSLFLDRG